MCKKIFVMGIVTLMAISISSLANLETNELDDLNSYNSIYTGVPVEVSNEKNIYSTRLWLGGYTPSDAYLDFIATHYQSVMVPSSKVNIMNALLDRNPDIALSLYTNPVFTQPSINYPEEYYAHSSQSTNYNNRVINEKFGTYLMNISSEGWRNEVATSAKNEVDAHGYYSVMADDCGPDISHRVDFIPDGYNVSKWRGDIKDTLSTINDELGNQTVFVFNGIYNDPEYTGRELLEVTDGGIREGFIFHLASGEFLPEEYWDVLLNYIIEDTQTDYHVASAKLKKKSGQTATTDERMFAFTSYLLVKNDNVIYSPEDWGLVTGIDETLVQYYPEMDIDIGDPVQTASRMEDYFNQETNLYERGYSKGKILVNPLMTSVTCNLEKNYILVIPEGGGVVTNEGTFGGSLFYRLVNNITIPAQSGVVLLEEGAVNLSINIEKPKGNWFYMFNNGIMPLKNTIILGKITIQAGIFSVYDVDRVEFYVDDILKSTDTEIPYKWTWNELAIGKHTIKILAYDDADNMASDEQKVWIFNI